MAGGIVRWTPIDVCGTCGRLAPIGSRKRVVMPGLRALSDELIPNVVTCGDCLPAGECSGSCGYCVDAELRADPVRCVMAASREKAASRPPWSPEEDDDGAGDR